MLPDGRQVRDGDAMSKATEHQLRQELAKCKEKLQGIDKESKAMYEEMDIVMEVMVEVLRGCRPAFDTYIQRLAADYYSRRTGHMWDEGTRPIHP